MLCNVYVIFLVISTICAFTLSCTQSALYILYFFAVEDHQAKIVQSAEIQTPIWEGLKDGDFLVLLSDT